MGIYFDDATFSHMPSPIVSVSDYFPFGLIYNAGDREGSYEQAYKYNGKEVRNELDLGWLDYGAGMYMADIGRWGSVDPLSPKYYTLSTYAYAYVANSPVASFDPDGKRIFFVNKNGELIKATRTLRRTLQGSELYQKYQNSESVDVYIAISSFGDQKGNAGGVTIANAHDYKKAGKKYGVFIQDSKLQIMPEVSDLTTRQSMKIFQNVDFSKSEGYQIHLISMSEESFKSHDEYVNAEAIYHELLSHIDQTTGSEEKDHEFYGKLAEGLYFKRPLYYGDVNPEYDDNGNQKYEEVERGSPAYIITKALISLKVYDDMMSKKNKKKDEQ